MKRLVTLLLALLMVFSLCACNGTDKPDATKAPEVTESVSKVDTCILMEEDENMINNYSLLAVNPDAPFTDADGNAVSGVKINADGAQALIEWMLSGTSELLIANYGVEEYGDKLFYLKDDAPKYDDKIAAANDDTKVIRLSTTTSVNDSGLLDYLLPVFEKEYGYKVEVQSAGTGKAIAAAKYGNADLILVHSKKQEEAFISEGFSYTLPGFDSERLCFMYNYFVLCGPSDDPAGVKNCGSVLDAFAKIADGKYKFISRGDNSGTHTKELSLWPESLGISAEPESFAGYTDWYTSANAGMGACLVMAEQLHAYILTDKATFMTFAANNGAMD